MDVDKILELLKDIMDCNSDELLKYKPYATIAANHIEAQCKENVKEKNKIKKEYENNLYLLAASLTNLLIVSKNSNKEPTGSFSGNGYKISIKQNSKIKNAEKLFDKCCALSYKFLNDGGFSFYSFAGYHVK